MADPSDSASWTIKSVPVETRRKAVNAAEADEQSVAQFVIEAVDLLLAKRAGDFSLGPTPLTPDQLTQRMMAVAALQQSTAAMKQATGRATGRAMLVRCMASLEQALLQAEGPPLAGRGRPGQIFGATLTLTKPDTREVAA